MLGCFFFRRPVFLSTQCGQTLQKKKHISFEMARKTPNSQVQRLCMVHAGLSNRIVTLQMFFFRNNFCFCYLNTNAAFKIPFFTGMTEFQFARPFRRHETTITNLTSMYTRGPEGWGCETNRKFNNKNFPTPPTNCHKTLS